MNRDKLTTWIQRTIGHYNFVCAQSWLKYQMNFRQDYSYANPQKGIHGETLVYMADGKTSHGGFSDRLRGIFSLYEYAKRGGGKSKDLFQTSI